MLATGRDTKFKAGKIRPQEAPSMIVGLNCQVNQYMNSAFLVVDLIRRNAGVELECHAEVLSIQNLITVKKRSGLSAEKRVKRVPAGRASPKTTGRIGRIL